jgi:hypothetical protein
MKTVFKLIEEHGLTLHGDIEHFAEIIRADERKQVALDKKAENARELGLDYEPDYKVTVVDDQHPNGVPLEQWGSPAPVREPVAKHYMDGGHLVYPAAQRQWTGLREAVEAEREACAKVCEDAPEPDGRDLAERIRNRGNT